MSISATVENGTVRLPGNIPDGTRVEVIVPDTGRHSEDRGPSLLDALAPWVGCIKDGPEDLAREHDHYAHGTPKRGPQ